MWRNHLSHDLGGTRALLLALGAAALLAGSAHAGWTFLSSPDGLAGNDALSIAKDGRGDLWFGTEDGASFYNGVTWTTYTRANGLADDRVDAILVDHLGTVWFGHSDGAGISRLRGYSWTYVTADSLGGGRVTSLAEDRGGRVWVGTWGGGLSRYDGSGWKHYRAADGLSGDFVGAIYEDRDGVLWAGTNGAGLSRYDARADRWSVVHRFPGASHDYVSAAFQDSQGRYWFGTAGSSGQSGLWCLGTDGTTGDDPGWRRYDAASTGGGLPDSHIQDIAEDQAGNIWVATWNGLACLTARCGWVPLGAGPDGPGDLPGSMRMDGSGGMWVGFAGAGVGRFDGSQQSASTDPDGAVSACIRP